MSHSSQRQGFEDLVHQRAVSARRFPWSQGATCSKDITEGGAHLLRRVVLEPRFLLQLAQNLRSSFWCLKMFVGVLVLRNLPKVRNPDLPVRAPCAVWKPDLSDPRLLRFTLGEDLPCSGRLSCSSEASLLGSPGADLLQGQRGSFSHEGLDMSPEIRGWALLLTRLGDPSAFAIRCRRCLMSGLLH